MKTTAVTCDFCGDPIEYGRERAVVIRDRQQDACRPCVSALVRLVTDPSWPKRKAEALDADAARVDE